MRFRTPDGKTIELHSHFPSALTQAGATTGQVLTWDGSNWAAAAPAMPSGTLTLTDNRFFCSDDSNYYKIVVRLVDGEPTMALQLLP
jgi:hypothetical protein